MKITAEKLTPMHLEHLRGECDRLAHAAGSWSCAGQYESARAMDAALAQSGDTAALERCVQHWHDTFCEDIADSDVREQAAQICSMVACGRHSSETAIGTYEAERFLFGETYTKAGDFARQALRFVPLKFKGGAEYAYAEALLRTGWTP